MAKIIYIPQKYEEIIESLEEHLGRNLTPNELINGVKNDDGDTLWRGAPELKRSYIDNQGEVIYIPKKHQKTIESLKEQLGRDLTPNELINGVKNDNGDTLWDGDPELKPYIDNQEQENGVTEPGIDSNTGSGINYYRDLISKELDTDPNSDYFNQYRKDVNESINAYEQASENTLANAEMETYKILGQKQLELENQIAAQRQQALKSGVTSAQLASQELGNIFAAQYGAQQVANATMSQRAQMADSFNQRRAGITGSVYDTINANKNTYANTMTQLGVAEGSYNSYINGAKAQLEALIEGYAKHPEEMDKIMGR